MHEGHRSRLINKIKNSDGLYEHELMELLLFSACPRKDVNYIAHGLIDRFGSIAGVFKADIEELMKVEGIGRNMAEYIRCLGLCLLRVRGSECFATVKSTFEFKKFITSRFIGLEEEKLELYSLDNDGRIRRVHPLKCDVGQDEKLRGVLKAVSLYKSGSLYAAHFHPSSPALPTPADDDWADAISCACTLDGIKLNDYCIVARDGDIYSYFVADRLDKCGRRPSGDYDGDI